MHAVALAQHVLSFELAAHAGVIRAARRLGLEATKWGWIRHAAGTPAGHQLPAGLVSLAPVVVEAVRRLPLRIPLRNATQAVSAAAQAAQRAAPVTRVVPAAVAAHLAPVVTITEGLALALLELRKHRQQSRTEKLESPPLDGFTAGPSNWSSPLPAEDEHVVGLLSPTQQMGPLLMTLLLLLLLLLPALILLKKRHQVAAPLAAPPRSVDPAAATPPPMLRRRRSYRRQRRWSMQRRDSSECADRTAQRPSPGPSLPPQGDRSPSSVRSSAAGWDGREAEEGSEWDGPAEGTSRERSVGRRPTASTSATYLDAAFGCMASPCLCPAPSVPAPYLLPLAGSSAAERQRAAEARRALAEARRAAAEARRGTAEARRGAAEARKEIATSSAGTSVAALVGEATRSANRASGGAILATLAPVRGSLEEALSDAAFSYDSTRGRALTPLLDASPLSTLTVCQVA